MKRDIKYIDLHLHTRASDGTWSNEELLKKLDEKGINTFAITDHDTIENALKMRRNVPSHMTHIFGAEISSTYKEKEYHILAYGFNPLNSEIKKLLEFNQKQRSDYNQRLITRIYDDGYLNSYDDFIHYSFRPEKGGFKSLNYLIDKGVVSDIKGFFKLVSQFEEKQIFLPPHEVIEAIKSAGGYAFLAHPSAYFKGALLDESILDYFKDIGISGVECYSPYLKDIKESEYYINYCNKHNLMISAGSDCHGDFLNRQLGDPLVSMKDVQLDKLHDLFK